MDSSLADNGAHKALVAAAEGEGVGAFFEGTEIEVLADTGFGNGLLVDETFVGIAELYLYALGLGLNQNKRKTIGSRLKHIGLQGVAA